MRALLLLCALTTAASAEPRFEIIDRDSAVEVIAHDVKATSTKILPIRSRLEVPIAPTAAIPKLQPADKTIKVVERDKNIVSIKLAFDHPEVVELAKVAQAMQVGDDLHILLPRAIPVAGQPITLPEPTLPPKLAEQAAALAPVPVVATPKPQPVVAPAPVAPQPVKVAPTQKPAVAAPAEGNSRTNTVILGTLALVALGCGTWLSRRNRNAAQAGSKIDVIAQRALGAKAKIVWLRAGERELLVTVAAQSVQVVTHWPAGETAPSRASLPPAIAQPEQGPASPAVAGILKLRARTSTQSDVVQPALSAIRKLRAPTHEDENLVADAEWAKEILAATGARR